MRSVRREHAKPISRRGISFFIATLVSFGFFLGGVFLPNYLPPYADQIAPSTLLVHITPEFPVEGDTSLLVRKSVDSVSEQIYFELRSKSALPAIRRVDVGWNEGSWSCLAGASSLTPGDATSSLPAMATGRSSGFRNLSRPNQILSKMIHQTYQGSPLDAVNSLVGSETVSFVTPAQRYVSAFECVEIGAVTVEVNKSQEVVAPTSVALKVDGMNFLSIDRSKTVQVPTDWQQISGTKVLFGKQPFSGNADFGWPAQGALIWDDPVVFIDPARSEVISILSTISTLLFGAWIALLFEYIAASRRSDDTEHRRTRHKSPSASARAFRRN
jgi:hypothetical protein